MRLTLRTLIAYLDDALPEEEGKELAAQIEQSEPAKDLMERRRSALSKLRLGAADPQAATGDFDPNTVAEYLDNTLAADRVTRFEKTCFESEEMFAEVCGVHQVISYSGPTAEMDGVLRKRLYRLSGGDDARRPTADLPEFPSYIAHPQPATPRAERVDAPHTPGAAQHTSSQQSAEAFTGTSLSGLSGRARADHSPLPRAGEIVKEGIRNSVQNPSERIRIIRGNAKPTQPGMHAGNDSSAASIEGPGVSGRSALTAGGGVRPFPAETTVPVTDEHAEASAQAVFRRSHPGQSRAHSPHFDESPREITRPQVQVQTQRAFPVWELAAFVVILLLGLAWMADQRLRGQAGEASIRGATGSLKMASTKEPTASTGLANPVVQANDTSKGVMIPHPQPQAPTNTGWPVEHKEHASAGPSLTAVASVEPEVASVAAAASSSTLDNESPTQASRDVPAWNETSMPAVEMTAVEMTGTMSGQETISANVVSQREATASSAVADAATSEAGVPLDPTVAESPQETAALVDDSASHKVAEVATLGELRPTAPLPVPKETLEAVADSLRQNAESAGLVSPGSSSEPTLREGSEQTEEAFAWNNEEVIAPGTVHSSSDEEASPAPLPEATVPESRASSHPPLVNTPEPAVTESAPTPLTSTIESTAADVDFPQTEALSSLKEQALPSAEVVQAAPTPEGSPSDVDDTQDVAKPAAAVSNSEPLAVESTRLEQTSHGSIATSAEEIQIKPIQGDLIFAAQGPKQIWSRSDSVAGPLTSTLLFAPKRHDAEFEIQPLGLHLRTPGWSLCKLQWDVEHNRLVLQVIFGNLILKNQGASSLPIEAVLADEHHLLTLSANATLGIVAAPQLENRPQDADNLRVIGKAYALTGVCEMHDSPSMRELAQLNQGDLFNFASHELEQADQALIEQFQKPSRLAMESQWIQRWQMALADQSTIEQGLLQLALNENSAGAKNTQGELGGAAAITLAWMGEPLAAVRALNDPRMARAWPDIIQHLRWSGAAAHGGRDRALEAFLRVYGNDVGQQFFEFCWGIDPQQAGPETDDLLVAGLDHPVLACRVLCLWNLQRLTGATHGYRPEADAAARARSLKSWQAALRQQRIRVSERSVQEDVRGMLR